MLPKRFLCLLKELKMQKVRLIPSVVNEGRCRILFKEVGEGAELSLLNVTLDGEFIVWEPGKSAFEWSFPRARLKCGKISRTVLGYAEEFLPETFEKAATNLFQKLGVNQCQVVLAFFFERGGEDYIVYRKLNFKPGFEVRPASFDT